MTNFENTKILLLYRLWGHNINQDNLFVSESGLIFEPTADSCAKLVCYDGNQKNVNVTQNVIIDDHNYTVTFIGHSAFRENKFWNL